MTKRKVLLCILDGFGIGEDYEFNAVKKAKKPVLDGLFEEYPSTELTCSGLEVGLPEGVMGNSEVGHLNIGAGRVVFQDVARINRSVNDGTFFQNQALSGLLQKTSDKKSALHIMGLVSDGDVHSSLLHLRSLIRAADAEGIENVFVHVFTDGRDTPPESGVKYVRELEDFIAGTCARIASVSGRYYAMDRDKRWDRVEKAYRCLTETPESTRSDVRAEDIILRSYSRGVTDEFIEPSRVIVNGEAPGTVKKGDSVIFFNFRADRARELSIALNCLEELPFRTGILDLEFLTMTEYREDFPFKVMFPKQYMNNILGEVVSRHEASQLRIAETEKYAHVTFFFNGGDEKTFPGEERLLIPSPKVATYDLKPEMSAYEVTEALLKQLSEERFDLIILNFANCDMVGHTGIFEAAKTAVETVDACVGSIYREACSRGYTMIITADHGNAEKMMDGAVPFTAHTTNKVPLLITDSSLVLKKSGVLADIAPTILDLMGIEKPVDMTGSVLMEDTE